MVANKKSQNQITAVVFIFLGFFIYGVSVGKVNGGESKMAIVENDVSSRLPASVD